MYSTIQSERIINFAKAKCDNKLLSLENLLGEFNQEIKEVSAINEARRKFNEIMQLSD